MANASLLALSVPYVDGELILIRVVEVSLGFENFGSTNVLVQISNCNEARNGSNATITQIYSELIMQVATRMIVKFREIREKRGGLQYVESC